MEIDKVWFAHHLRIAVGHGDGGSFLESEMVREVCREVLEKSFFRQTGIVEGSGEAEFAQERIRGITNIGHGGELPPRQ